MWGGPDDFQYFAPSVPSRSDSRWLGNAGVAGARRIVNREMDASTRSVASGGVLSIICKLGHSDLSVRERALKSILFKLEHGLVAHEQLYEGPGGNNEIFPLLLEWFNFPTVSMQAEVLAMIHGMCERCADASALFVQSGGLAFLEAFKADAAADNLPLVEATLNLLLMTAPQDQAAAPSSEARQSLGSASAAPSSVPTPARSGHWQPADPYLGVSGIYASGNPVRECVQTPSSVAISQDSACYVPDSFASSSRPPGIGGSFAARGGDACPSMQHPGRPASAAVAEPLLMRTARGGSGMTEAGERQEAALEEQMLRQLQQQTMCMHAPPPALSWNVPLVPLTRRDNQRLFAIDVKLKMTGRHPLQVCVCVCVCLSVSLSLSLCLCVCACACVCVCECECLRVLVRVC